MFGINPITFSLIASENQYISILYNFATKPQLLISLSYDFKITDAFTPPNPNPFTIA